MRFPMDDRGLKYLLIQSLMQWLFPVSDDCVIVSESSIRHLTVAETAI
jgi:hypothetical protein